MPSINKSNSEELMREMQGQAFDRVRGENLRICLYQNGINFRVRMDLRELEESDIQKPDLAKNTRTTKAVHAK